MKYATGLLAVLAVLAVLVLALSPAPARAADAPFWCHASMLDGLESTQVCHPIKGDCQATAKSVKAGQCSPRPEATCFLYYDGERDSVRYVCVTEQRACMVLRQSMAESELLTPIVPCATVKRDYMIRAAKGAAAYIREQRQKHTPGKGPATLDI